MGRTVQTSRKKKLSSAKKRVRSHNYAVAVPRSLGAGGPPGAVKYLSTPIESDIDTTVAHALPGLADCPNEGIANSGILNVIKITQGPGSQQRKYNKVVLKSIAVRGTIRLGDSNDAVSVTGVLMLVYDRNRNQRTDLAITEMLNVDAQGGVGERSLSAPDGAPRFKVLRRWPYVLGQGAGSGSPAQIHIDAFVNLKNKTASWINGNTDGASVACMDGPLYLVHVSSSFANANVAKAPVVLGMTRVYFQDPK